MSVRCKCDRCGYEYWGSSPDIYEKMGSPKRPHCPECGKKYDVAQEEARRIKTDSLEKALKEAHTSLTTDRNDPDLGVSGPDGQNKKYLILSEEERAKGFVRPVYRA